MSAANSVSPELQARIERNDEAKVTKVWWSIASDVIHGGDEDNHEFESAVYSERMQAALDRMAELVQEKFPNATDVYITDGGFENQFSSYSPRADFEDGSAYEFGMDALTAIEDEAVADAFAKFPEPEPDVDDSPVGVEDVHESVCDECHGTGWVDVSYASAENGPTDDPADEIGRETCECEIGQEIDRQAHESNERWMDAMTAIDKQPIIEYLLTEKLIDQATATEDMDRALEWWQIKLQSLTIDWTETNEG